MHPPPHFPGALKPLAALFLLFTVAITPSEARLSQVFHQEVSLEELRLYGAWVLVVRLDTPPTRTVSVPYSLKTEDGKRVESTYGLPVARVVVEEVIVAEGEAPAVGAALELYESESLSMFAITLEYEASGMSESPIFHRFKGENLYATHPADARFIVFLRPPAPLGRQEGPFEDAWASMAKAIDGMSAFAVGGAVLPLSRRAEVEALLNPPGARPVAPSPVNPTVTPASEQAPRPDRPRPPRH
ncbi:MAG: hypothetical protein IPI35_06545 [Deltaproteobacteria bacterium]|nr:hypothetical protein [Deltaproteobacteria bacterium]